MEQVLNLMGPASFVLGMLLTFYRMYLSQKDWNRIRDMPGDTISELQARITAMGRHLDAAIGSVGWQATPIIIGFGISFICALLRALLEG